MGVIILVLLVLINLVSLKSAKAQVLNPIVGGTFTKIEDFPYIVLINIIACDSENSTKKFLCGASVVNQDILLTAGHCLIKCRPTTIIKALVGSAYRRNSSVYFSSKFKVHEDYYPQHNDIALVKLKHKLKLGKHVQRVALMPEPPYFEPAVVAGWGITDVEFKNRTDWLMHINQKVWDRQSCVDAGYEHLPNGTFCAGDFEGTSHASFGDSGSPLVVRGLIQIGLVSYRNTEVSANVVVYTDIGYFYDWIKEEATKLCCSTNYLNTSESSK